MSDDDTMGVVIRRDFGGLAEVKERSGAATCRHLATVVDEEARTVECGTCGKALDPVQVLLEYAKRERRWRHWDGESTKALTHIAELKAEEKKIKARTKSASRKDSNQAVRDEQARTEKMRFDLIQDARDLAALAARIEQRCRRKGTP